ncbi:RNA polymerase sigma-70 factor [Microlunatus ginsengisoli]|uniref:RNA polymerase sigma-70 factor n=1 Tax=Microlunatus ginsengisoli TaxID=363863 RepID=A0ABP7APL5_9ACTN
MSQAAILDLRPYLFSIAYRMLGTVSDAEDVVQEAYLRLAGATDVEHPKAYAATVTTRIAIDTLTSARVRRERYVGQWLPEPLLSDELGPEERFELDESVSIAFLVLLETLSPLERAAFVLHDALDYSYPEVAAVLERDEAACRQLVSRARRHLDARRPRFEADRDQRDRLANAFLAAAADGDVAALEQLLAEDVRCVGDGGGKVPAAAKPVVGRTRSARFLAGLVRQADRLDLAARATRVNGQPGLLLTAGEYVVGVLELEIADGQIQAVHNVINPDKLRHLGPVTDWDSLRVGR